MDRSLIADSIAHDGCPSQRIAALQAAGAQHTWSSARRRVYSMSIYRTAGSRRHV